MPTQNFIGTKNGKVPIGEIILTKTAIAPAANAIIEINAFASQGILCATTIHIGVKYSAAALQAHFNYKVMTIGGTTAVGGQTTIEQTYNGSAGLFAVAIGDFVVTRGTNKITITYTNSGDGNNDIYVIVHGYNVVSATIA